MCVTISFHMRICNTTVCYFFPQRTVLIVPNVCEGLSKQKCSHSLVYGIIIIYSLIRVTVEKTSMTLPLVAFRPSKL